MACGKIHKYVNIKRERFQLPFLPFGTPWLNWGRGCWIAVGVQLLEKRKPSQFLGFVRDREPISFCFSSFFLCRHSFLNSNCVLHLLCWEEQAQLCPDDDLEATSEGFLWTICKGIVKGVALQLPLRYCKVLWPYCDSHWRQPRSLRLLGSRVFLSEDPVDLSECARKFCALSWFLFWIP